MPAQLSRRQLTDNRLNRTEVWYMVKRRAKQASIDTDVCNHTFRGTGLTAYLENPDARLKHAQQRRVCRSNKQCF